MAKVRSPHHDDGRPRRPLVGDTIEALPVAAPAASAAAPEGAHVASFHSATNRMAPVRREECAAVEAQGRAPVTENVESAGGVVAGPGIAGIAGIAAAPGTTRRGDHGERTILHVDIDAFFAAIEQQRDPRLKGKPVIVGAGVIASCSYEARAFGLKAGMSLGEAKRICPQAVIIDGHAQVYRCFAEEIFAYCRRIAPEVETYLDEAYCDLSGTERLHGDLARTARALKHDILAATGLTVTCGLGPNRMLAKLVGKTVKPDGLACITAGEADAFLVDRPVEQLAGVGHAHAKTLRSMNLKTIGDLRVLPVEVLAALFGVHGRLLYERCRGKDTAAVTEREIPLSISRETSFHRDTADRGEIEGMLEYLVGRACRTARELAIRPRTIGVHLRYSDGEGAERERSLSQASDTDPVVLELTLDLLRKLFTRRVALHAVGMHMSHFSRAGGEQGSLFDEREAGRRAQLYKAFDHVRGEFGHGVLVSGRALRLKNTVAEDRNGFVLRTPSLTK